jgi:hypothetical protein
MEEAAIVVEHWNKRIPQFDLILCSSVQNSTVADVGDVEAMKKELQSIHGAYEAAMARLQQTELQVQQLRVENSALQSRSAVDDSREVCGDVTRFQPPK